MRLFSKEATGYAVLLVILLALSALAVHRVLGFISDSLPPGDYAIAAAAICVITFGFMLIAGAYGLWAIRFAAVTEGHRRIGQLVEAMDYIQDGVFVVDLKGRITGSNPAVKGYSSAEISPHLPLTEALPCLSDEELHSILQSKEPIEIERQVMTGDTVRTLRFRSQPLSDLALLLVSDVSGVAARRVHNRLTARLQLIGEIARGVANDFNNILCAISGHAALLSRLPPESPEIPRSIRAIAKGAERGSLLATQLLELSAPSSGGGTALMSSEYLESAATSLRNSLSEEWRIETKFDAMPGTSLSGLKLEQVVLTLGLQVADRAAAPGVLRLVASRPQANVPVLNVGNEFAGVLLVSAAPPDASVQVEPGREDAAAGAIESVIRSMVENSKGRLDCYTTSSGSLLYRVSLPRESLAGPHNQQERFAAELGPYVANWSILLVSNPSGENRLNDRLRGLGVHRIEQVDNMLSALARIESGQSLDAIIIDDRIIPIEARGLLRALLKLCGGAAVVVLCDAPGEIADSIATDVVFVRHADAGDRILLALVEARSLAVKRRNPTAG